MEKKLSQPVRRSKIRLISPVCLIFLKSLLQTYFYVLLYKIYLNAFHSALPSQSTGATLPSYALTTTGSISGYKPISLHCAQQEMLYYYFKTVHSGILCSTTLSCLHSDLWKTTFSCRNCTKTSVQNLSEAKEWPHLCLELLGLNSRPPGVLI